jgi:hypothetical protein
MTQDRNYLRMLNVRDLTLIASERFTTDLELVLLERLEHLIGVDDELEHLQTLYDRLVAENNALRDDMAE